MKVVVFTLGCKVNSCESQALLRGFSDLGFEVSEELEFADVYVINTCAVTNEAEKKSRQAVARVKKFNKNAKIIVAGCASERFPESFLDKDGVSLVFGTSSKEKILQLFNENGLKLQEPELNYHELPTPKTDKRRAYIKIQDGCNNFCSYCIIPYLRGRSRSRSPLSIKDEILLLNPKEAVLTAINLSSYNYNGLTIIELINELKDVNSRIRLGSLEENVITEEFLISLKGLKDFAPHFHLSLQSGSNKILKDMRRRYTTDDFLHSVELIRKHFINPSITTDVIVGYPTETDKDFNESIEFIKKVGFSDIHAFCYSKRQGTLASKLKDLPSCVKKQRLNELLKIKNNLKSAFISKNIQTIQSVVIEEYKDGYSIGYTGNYIKIYIKSKLEMEKYDVTVTEEFLDGALGVIKE